MLARRLTVAPGRKLLPDRIGEAEWDGRVEMAATDRIDPSYRS